MDDLLIDYDGIKQGIRRAINSYRGLEDLPVHLEWAGMAQRPTPPPSILPCALIYMVGRRTPERHQRMTAGRTTHYELVFSVWCLHYSMDSMEVAARFRDDLVARVDAALMRDNNLGGLLSKGSWIEAGDVLSGADPQAKAYVAGIETRFIAAAETSLR